jgi:hypothetical protein
MNPPMCFRNSHISPNLNPYSVCITCQFKTECTNKDLEIGKPRMESEWVCKSCDDTECHFTINAKLQVIQPVRCPLSGMEGRLLGLNQHWVRLK